MHIKETEYGSILYQCSKGPDKSKKQGDVQSDKKAADLFWHGGTDRSTVIFSDEDSNEIKEGINNLDKQRLFHLDFYSRYGILRKTDRDDYKELLEIKLEELSALKEEHEVTKQLWTRYKGL